MTRTIHSGSRKSPKAQPCKKTGVQKKAKKVHNKRKSEVEQRRVRGELNIRQTQRHPYTLRTRPHSYNLRLRTVNSQGAGDRVSPTASVLGKRKCNCDHNKSGRAVKRRKAQSHISVVTISSTDDNSNMDRTADWLENMDGEAGINRSPSCSLKEHQQDQENKGEQSNLVDKNVDIEVCQDSTLNDEETENLHTSLLRKSDDGLSRTVNDDKIAAEAKLLGNVLKMKLAECIFENIDKQVPEDFYDRLEVGSASCLLEGVNCDQIGEESKYRYDTFKIDVTIRIYPLETMNKDQIAEESKDLFKPLESESSINSSEILSDGQGDKNTKDLYDPVERETVFRSIEELSYDQLDEDSEDFKDSLEKQSSNPSLDASNYLQVEKDTEVSLEMESAVHPLKTVSIEQISEESEDFIDLLAIEYDEFHPWDTMNDDKIGESTDLCDPLEVHEITVQPLKISSVYQIDNNTESLYDPVERESTQTMRDFQIGENTEEFYQPIKEESAVHPLNILSSDQIEVTNGLYDNLNRDSVVPPLQTFIEDKIVKRESALCLLQGMSGDTIEEDTEEVCIPLGREFAVCLLQGLSGEKIEKDTEEVCIPSGRESAVCLLQGLSGENIEEDTEEVCIPLGRESAVCLLQGLSGDTIEEDTEEMCIPLRRESAVCLLQGLKGENIEEDTEEVRIPLGRESAVCLLQTESGDKIYEETEVEREAEVIPLKSTSYAQIVEDTKDMHDPLGSELAVCSLKSLNNDTIENLSEPLEKKLKICPIQAPSKDQTIKGTVQLNNTVEMKFFSYLLDTFPRANNGFFFGSQSTLYDQDLRHPSDRNPVVIPFETFIKHKIDEKTKDVDKPINEMPGICELENSSQNQSTEEVELNTPAAAKRKLDSSMLHTLSHTNTAFYEHMDKKPCIEIEPTFTSPKRELDSSQDTLPHTNKDVFFGSQSMSQDLTFGCTNIFQNPLKSNSSSTQTQSDEDDNETNNEQSDNFFFGPQSVSNDWSFICTNHFQNPPKAENNSNSNSTQPWFDEDTEEDEDETNNKCKDEN